MLSSIYIPANLAHSVTQTAVRAFAYSAGRMDLVGPNSALAARHAT
jgi:hypothetical protein